MRSVRRVFSAAGIIAAVVLFIAACSGNGEQTDQGGAAGSPSQQARLDEILERGVLRVGTTGDFFMSFIDSETGERMGYDVDVVTRFAADMGVELEFVTTDWANLVTGLAADRYDMTTGASYNLGRARSAAYTLPISSVGTVALVNRADAGRFASWEAINSPEVTVAVRLGTVFEDQVGTIVPDAEIVRVQAPANEYQEILSGRADVAVTSLFDAKNLTTRFEELVIADVPLEARNAIGLLVRRGDQSFLNYVNTWITQMEYAGFFADLRAKWDLPQ